MIEIGRARRVLGVLLVAAAIAVAGCGSDETDQYKEDAKAIIDPLRGTLNSTNERVSAAKNLDQRIAALDETRRALDKAAADLNELDPPEDAKAQHDRFVKELERFAGDIRAFEKAARKNDTKGVRESLDKLRTDTARLKQANNALKAKVDE